MTASKFGPCEVASQMFSEEHYPQKPIKVSKHVAPPRRLCRYLGTHPKIPRVLELGIGSWQVSCWSEGLAPAVSGEKWDPRVHGRRCRSFFCLGVRFKASLRHQTRAPGKRRKNNNKVMRVAGLRRVLLVWESLIDKGLSYSILQEPPIWKDI